VFAIFSDRHDAKMLATLVKRQFETADRAAVDDTGARAFFDFVMSYLRATRGAAPRHRAAGRLLRQRIRKQAESERDST